MQLNQLEFTQEIMEHYAQIEAELAAERIQMEQEQNPLSPPVRQSARLMGKSPIKTYSVKRKKLAKPLEVGQASVRAGLKDSELIRAIRAENLDPNPMQVDLANQVDEYCGVMHNNLDDLMDTAGGEQVEPRATVNEKEGQKQLTDEEEDMEETQGDESVLGAGTLELDSADELTEDEGEST